VFCTSDMMTWHFAEDVSWRSTGLIWARVFFRLVLGDADGLFAGNVSWQGTRGVGLASAFLIKTLSEMCLAKDPCLKIP
jgi:hypothetical protein